MHNKNKTPDFDTELAGFTPRQLEAIRKLDSGEIKFLLYGGALGGGKLLRLSTPIPTVDGWVKMSNIKVGHRVFDEKGQICNVVAVSEEQFDKTYCIKFSDGSEIVAGASHEWVTETLSDRQKQLRHSEKYRINRKRTRVKRGTGKRPDLAVLNGNRVYIPQEVLPTVKTTQEIHDTLKIGNQVNHCIPVCGAINLPDQKVLVDPYVLGAWLGDGCSSSGQIAGEDQAILDNIREAGYEVTDHANVLSSHGILKLKIQLRELGVLNNKHIPIQYLRASINQRLALLQGLMDTDGYCDLRGQCEIQVVNKVLAENIQELLHTLGIKVCLKVGRALLYGKDCGEKYRLKFLSEWPCFRVKRKLDRQKREGFRGTHNRRYIVSVNELPAEKMKCIEVDSPSHLYLAGESMIPTHNSYFLRWYGVRRLMVLFKVFGIKNAAGMLACEDYPSLSDRQLQKIATQFPPWLGTLYDKHKVYGRCFLLNPKWGSGALCFRNLDDPSKYASSEWAFILVDELTKNKIDIFTFLRTRLRWPGLDDIECQFVAGTNPGGIGHSWVKQLWMDKDFPEEFIKPKDYRSQFDYVPSLASDNPNLGSDYWAQLSTLPEQLRRAFKDGDWDIFIGQAFPQFSRQKHVGKVINIPDYAQLYMTFDWGFGAPFSIGWWWVDADGRIWRFAEWYGWNGHPNQGLRLEDSAIADGILQRERDLGITGRNIIRLSGPDCFSKKPNYQGGGQGPSTSEVFASRGILLNPGDASRELKIRQFRERLTVKEGEMPMMMIAPECDQFIRTIPNLVMDERHIEDIDTSGEDHIYDEACHICMARPLSIMPKYQSMTIGQLVDDYITGKSDVLPWEMEAGKLGSGNKYINFGD